MTTALDALLADPRAPYLAVGLAAIFLLWVISAPMRRAARAAQATAAEVARLSQKVRKLGDGQQQLSGGLAHVAEAQAASQSGLLHLVERRLGDVQQGMTHSLGHSATRTARSLGALQERLDVIDKAQAKIEALSGNVLGLQDILSNKQTRGAFGEIQLNDLVSKALPADSYRLQATLANGRRADCLIMLPDPPGQIVIDAKFPLDAYERLMRAEQPRAQAEARRDLASAVRTHIRHIAERYIVEGETADGAIMFLPSEAVFSELHAHHGAVVREGFAAQVWIVSPTTCMATLTTMRAILKDARMRAQASAIRHSLRLLKRDVDLVVARAEKLETHMAQARADIDGLGTAAGRAGKRAERLETFEFDSAEDAGESRAARDPEVSHPDEGLQHLREQAREA